VSAPQWIIGNYAFTLPIRLGAADTVVFLDFPARICLLGIAGRRFRHGHGHGQHDAIGVYDRITWNFVHYIIENRGRMAPRVRELIATHPTHATHAEVVVLGTRRSVRRYLADTAGSGS
jgi:hypothetical protein